MVEGVAGRMSIYLPQYGIPPGEIESSRLAIGTGVIEVRLCAPEDYRDLLAHDREQARSEFERRGNA